MYNIFMIGNDNDGFVYDDGINNGKRDGLLSSWTQEMKAITKKNIYVGRNNGGNYLI